MKRTIVAGHICLDMIPAIDHALDMQPGRLYEVGAATVSTGGAVSNTGIALHILGVPTSLAGKIGDDMFGHAVLDLVKSRDPAMADGMIVEPNAVTSYSVVINIPGIDRTFLHCPGANHTFSSADIQPANFQDAALFHFGYPPLMQRTYTDGGHELTDIFQRVKAAGITTSLDMTMPDPGGPSGEADWKAILTMALPHVDIFMPSADEILYMLDREKFGQGDDLKGDDVSRLGEQLLSLGAAVAGVTLGARGLYLRTAGEDRLKTMGAAMPANIANWANRELWIPVYHVDQLVGATGAGDATFAGFLAALLRNMDIETAGSMANAVGACNVQAADALGGIQPWDATTALVNNGWERAALNVGSPGWQQTDTGVWRGPHDTSKHA
ncbi:MAG: carbohydrate kinase family protein [Kiritimatiellales bacterium]|nr:carbohydrate kinase family protein [Kiritimatiellales bacterium]